MTLSGHMQNGVAVFDTPVDIPDGTPVQISVKPDDSSFWHQKSIEQLAAEQGVKPVQDISELAGDWPPDESIDEFLAFIREIRR